MEVLSLNRFRCFSNSNNLLKLNDLAEVNESLMPHQVASATGCELDDAMALLLFLTTISVVQAKLFGSGSDLTGTGQVVLIDKHPNANLV